MSHREVALDSILASIGDGGDDAVLRSCVSALSAHPRPSYVIGGTPADQLRGDLELKYRRARSRGKILVGDRDLLMRLQGIGGQLVAGVSAHSGEADYIIYLSPATLKPLGAVIMRDADSDGMHREH